MKFEWDENKNRINLEKHGIDFETAKEVFEDTNAVTQNSSQNEEERWKRIGKIYSTLFSVIYTIRPESIIRLISARKANKKETQHYQNRQ